MYIHTLPLGVCATNCYLLSGDGSHCIIVDPADKAEVIASALQKHGYTPDAIFLTHGHFDHIYALPTLLDLCGKLPVYLHEKEVPYLADRRLNLSDTLFDTPFVYTGAVRTLAHGDTLSGGGLDWKLLHTPGHTVGSSCLFDEKEHVLISGDTLFSASVGRTDFPGGDTATLHRSLKALTALASDGDVTVYPGHGESTSLLREIRFNPYLQ